MLIIGAGGFAKELLEVLLQQHFIERILFYDDIAIGGPNKVFDRYEIIHDKESAKKLFQSGDARFALGLGGPQLREKLASSFSSLGGELTSVISPFAQIGINGNRVGNGVNVMTGAVLSSEVSIGNGTLIYFNCTIAHNSIIGRFCQLSPGVHISGRVRVGDNCFFGTGAVVLPDIAIGENVVVGAGAVVNKNVPSNTTVVGNPAKPLKK